MTSSPSRGARATIGPRRIHLPNCRRRRVAADNTRIAIDVALHTARAAIQTRLGVTIQKRLLAIVASEAGRTRAGVRALPSIKAGAIVPAGLVIRTVVQILITEETTPTLIAQTLPRLVTNPVLAARVHLALIAKRSLPASVTYAFVGSIAVSVLLVASGQAAGFVAVVTGPSREANTFACRTAAVMPESIVPRPTEILTLLPIVVLRADHSEPVGHHRMSILLLNLYPFWSNAQPHLGR